MTRNLLSLRYVSIAGVALSCVLARADGQEPASASQGNTAVLGIPNTVATLPNDTEGLTVDPDTGILYTAQGPDASSECFVTSITLTGVVSVVGTLPKPLGSTCSPRGLEFRSGHVYVADQGTDVDGWVFEIDPSTGQATTFAAGVPGANGIVFDSHGNLWITDSQRGFGRVYRRDAATGVVQEAFRVPPVANGTSYGGRLSSPSSSGIGRRISNIPGMLAEVRQVANGIAVVERFNDAAHSIGEGRPRVATLYVGDTARGAIWAVRLDERGALASGQTGCDPTLQGNTLCEDAVFVAHPRLEGADGIWPDRDGNLLVAVPGRQAIVRVDQWGNVAELFRNPVNSQLMRSSSDTAEGNTHILEYPTNPGIVPAFGGRPAPTVCVTSYDRPGRDNAPGTVGEIGGPGQDKGKISCFEPLDVPFD